MRRPACHSPVDTHNLQIQITGCAPSSCLERSTADHSLPDYLPPPTRSPRCPQTAVPADVPSSPGHAHPRRDLSLDRFRAQVPQTLRPASVGKWIRRLWYSSDLSGCTMSQQSKSMKRRGAGDPSSIGSATAGRPVGPATQQRRRVTECSIPLWGNTCSISPYTPSLPASSSPPRAPLLPAA